MAAMTAAEVQALYDAIDRITDIAQSCELDFFPMRYEICPADIIYTFGAYGMPIRFSHWSFGKSFHRLKTQYDWGLSKIYELVINSDPCYAFLLESNSLLQNKLIAAHVLGHSDFFKNNWRFGATDRQMIWSMAAFAGRVREYEHDLGRARVERFLDAVLSISEHIDPHLLLRPSPEQPAPPHAAGQAQEDEPQRKVTPYDDLWDLELSAAERNRRRQAEAEPPRRRRPEPQRDLLSFFLERCADLQDWQRDILSAIRKESLYFRPQMETKIMNEGWASYWHTRIMRELDLADDEALDFARMHASVLAPSRQQLNPYYLGFKIFEDIEKRFDRQKIFEVRQLESDVSFLRNYLTKELVEDLDLYLYKKQGDRYLVSHDQSEWEQVRDGIISLITNCGFPYVYAVDDDYEHRGELMLRHGYEGVELDTRYLSQTLHHVQFIWGRPVHLETVEDDVAVLYTCTGKDQIERKPLAE